MRRVCEEMVHVCDDDCGDSSVGVVVWYGRVKVAVWGGR